ncbi:SDR family oxidoreductase [Nocardioides sp. NPDC006303]|uniref:SDR family NAD(P)-dependent oxidoreductase n=1 Tax=Nocardioides sp. NPDC006303 TaxID=3156747 RepID=UPI0033BE53DE
MFELDDKTAVITGAGSGIGRACAVRLAEAGAFVVGLDLDEGSARETADTTGGLGIGVDVSDSVAMEQVFTDIAGRRGSIHALVNNAGIALDPATIADTEPDHLMKHLEVNTLGVLNGLRHGGKHMSDGGAIVNTSSVAGVFGIPGYASYATSKFGVVGLTKVAAVELGPRGIRVNAVCPTTVDTPMLYSFPAGAQEAKVLGDAAALGGIIDAEHVAAMVHFLVADDCPVLSGLAIPIDKGIAAGISRTRWDSGAI